MLKRKNGLIISIAVLLIVAGSVGIGFNLTKIKSSIQHFEESYETKNIDTLSLDIGNRGETTIHYTNSDQIQVTLSGTNFEKTPLKSSYSKDKIQLTVPSEKEYFLDQLNFNINLLFMDLDFNSSVNLDIYVPKSIQNIEVTGTSANLYVSEEIALNKMKITTDSGNINISELNADKLTIKTSSGSIELDDVTANKTKFEARSGNIYLNELHGAIKGEVTSGNISLTNDELNQEIDFEATSGNIDINVESVPKDTTIKTKTSVGYVDLDGSDIDKQKTFGKGSNKVSLKTSSGNIFVGFNSFFDNEESDD